MLPERPADVIDNLVAILDQRLPGEAAAAAEEVDEDVTPAKGLARAFSLLIRKINPDLSKFAQDLGITAQALSLALPLVAEHSLCMQQANLEAILQYVSDLSRAGVVRGIAFIWRCSYDETPLRVKVVGSAKKCFERE